MAFIALVAMLVGFAANQPVPTAAASEDLAAIQKRGYLVVGLSADYAPLEFHATLNGADTIVGADISMSKQIAKDMGVKLQIKEMNFTALIGALKTGKIDLIVSGMSKTPEREKEVNFSTPYLYETQVMVIRKADKAKYKSIADFSGKKVGAQKQTTQEQLAKTQLPGAKISSLDKANDVIAQVSYNKLDGAVLASTIADSYVARTPSLMVLNPHFATPKAPTAIAVSKQNSALLAQVNKTISKVKGAKYKTYLQAAYKLQDQNQSFWAKYGNYFLRGALYTLIFAVLIVFFGTVIGTLLALMKLSHSWFAKAIANVYIEFIRGTPLLVQAFHCLLCKRKVSVSILAHSLPVPSPWPSTQVPMLPKSFVVGSTPSRSVKPRPLVHSDSIKVRPCVMSSCRKPPRISGQRWVMNSSPILRKVPSCP